MVAAVELVAHTKQVSATAMQDLTHLAMAHLWQFLPMLDLQLSAQAVAVAVVDQVLEMQLDLLSTMVVMVAQVAHLMETMAAAMAVVLSKMETLTAQLVALEY